MASASVKQRVQAFNHSLEKAHNFTKMYRKGFQKSEISLPSTLKMCN